MDTGLCDPSDPIGVRTFVVRIYQRRDASCPATVSGVVEQVPESRRYAFNSIGELGAILSLPRGKQTRLRKKPVMA